MYFPSFSQSRIQSQRHQRSGFVNCQSSASDSTTMSVQPGTVPHNIPPPEHPPPHCIIWVRKAKGCGHVELQYEPPRFCETFYQESRCRCQPTYEPHPDIQPLPGKCSTCRITDSSRIDKWQRDEKPDDGRPKDMETIALTHRMLANVTLCR